MLLLRERCTHDLVCLSAWIYLLFSNRFTLTHTHKFCMDDTHKFMEYVVVVVVAFLNFYFIFFLCVVLCLSFLFTFFFTSMCVCECYSKYLFRLFGFICPFTEITQIDEVIIIMNRVSNARLFQWMHDI